MSNNHREKKFGARAAGKPRGEPCLICGEDRWSDDAHFPGRKRDGKTQTIHLCPTHHHLLDKGRISREEMKKIWKMRFPRVAVTVEDFVEWAHRNGYPYSLDDLKRKFWSIR